jgi:hypothetical protein
LYDSRYCINSSSLNFHASDSGEGSDQTDAFKPEILKFKATIDGCGSDGFCSLKARDGSVKKRIEDSKKSPEKEVEQSV